jgi:hypothetical protein
VHAAPPPPAVTTKKDLAALATPASPPVVQAIPAAEQQPSRNNYKHPQRAPEPTSLPVHPERQISPAPVPTVGKHNDQALPPAPPVVLLNPGTADVGERTVSEQAREHQHSPASTARGKKKNEQVTPPAQTVPRIVQRPVVSSINEENTTRGATAATRDLRGLRRTSRIYDAEVKKAASACSWPVCDHHHGALELGDRQHHPAAGAQVIAECERLKPVTRTPESCKRTLCALR